MTQEFRAGTERSHARRALPALAVLLLLAAATPRGQNQGPGPDLWTTAETQVSEADWSDRVPAHIAVVDGDAWLTRDGRADRADQNTPLLSGDRLRTDRGRVVVLFADGGALSLDEDTNVEFLSDALLRLAQGRIRLTLARRAGETAYRIDAAGTTTWIRSAGEYRVTTDATRRADPDVHLLVIRGLAELSSPYGRTTVRAGYEVHASARRTPTAPSPVAVASSDAFDRWVESRLQDRYALTASTYLPAELRSYDGILDRYGDWHDEGSYGYVWYPRVDHDWRPYGEGRWSLVGSFGWTWIGQDRWSWPTHHYGRWGMSGARWYWIPGRRWGPAWVSWASAPGYVSWSPLGYNNRPLVSINIGDPGARRGWSYAPSGTFAAGTRFTSRDRLGLPAPSVRFVERTTAPARPRGTGSNRQPLGTPRQADVGRPTAAPRDPGVGRRAVNGPTSATEQPRSPDVVDSSRRAPVDRRPSRPSEVPSNSRSPRGVVEPEGARNGLPMRPAQGQDDGRRSSTSPRSRVIAPPERAPEAVGDPRRPAPPGRPQSGGDRPAREAAPPRAEPSRVERPERPPSREGTEAPASAGRAPRSAPGRTTERSAPSSSGPSSQGRAVPRGTR